MPIMRKCLFLLLVTAIFTISTATNRNHKKRQIYREQVLPHAGGKIPDTAFETDRLYLNRLQKEGSSVPDGIVTEQRSPQVYQYHDKSPRLVYHIALSSDGRYTPSEGRYRYHETPSVETTYLYPQIHGEINDAAQSKPAYPVYRQLQLYNSQLFQNKLQAKKKTQYLGGTPHLSKGHSLYFRTKSYQNFNIMNRPIVPAPVTAPVAVAARTTANGHNVSKYGPFVSDLSASAHLFNEFNEFFNDFNLHENGAVICDKAAIVAGSKHNI